MSGDEIETLSKRIRYLERELRYARSARERLEELNDRNQVIRSRSNEELNQKNTELEAALERLLRAQAQLVQAEKMASLGQLVASIAHELNTPLGAIRASAENLKSAVRTAAVSLPHALAALDPREREGWRRLTDEALEGRTVIATPREERQFRRQMSAALDEAGIAVSQQLALLLVEMGVTGAIEAHLSLLRSPAAETMLQHVHDVVGAIRSSENIRVAGDRAAKIVFALKSYAHPGANGEPAEGAITENLDTVLMLYQGQIKHGIELVRDYRDPGHLIGRHDELNQVWTNLLHNALQAMDHHGELLVRVLASADGAVQVDITDSGHGIPEGLQSRVFEPFFTTKRMGEGSGLGLSISRDIVVRHKGTISFTTRPGQTTFSVVLPRQGMTEPVP